jgi:hypothetical protein
MQCEIRMSLSIPMIAAAYRGVVGHQPEMKIKVDGPLDQVRGLIDGFDPVSGHHSFNNLQIRQGVFIQLIPDGLKGFVLSGRKFPVFSPTKM